MGVIIEVRNPVEDLEEKIKAHKRKFWRKVILTTITLIAALVSTFLLIELQTYDVVRTVQNYPNASGDNSSYMQYSTGIVKYSRDGIAFLNRKGEEQWNQSYQVKNPFVKINKEAVALGDRGGNDIYVFNKRGLRGEIHTNYPIESMTVSENGIVCALLKNENAPLVVCYDAAGSVLVEHRSSVTGTGYPIGMAVSPDGSVLQVSYLCVVDGVQATKVVYYNFNADDAEESQQTVTEDIYKNEIIPTTFFVDNKTSILAGDQGFYIYNGQDKPSMETKVSIDKEIESIFYDAKNIGFVLENSGDSENELRVYNLAGKQTLSKGFSGEYSNVKISNGDVIMYDGMKCTVFSSWGVQKFVGELENNIMDIVPLTGINKYLILSENGIEEVRFGK